MQSGSAGLNAAQSVCFFAAVALGVLLGSYGCSASLDVPAGTVITCDNGACPSGYFCQSSSQVCVLDSGRKNNRPPVIQTFTAEDAQISGLAILRFTISDSSADVVRFGRFEVATNADFTDGYDVPLDETDFPSGVINGLTTSRDGVEHSVTWDSAKTAAFATSNAYLRLTVADVFDAPSEPVVLGPIALVNQTPPRAAITYIKNGGDGVIPIAYTLIDEESDIADVRIEQSTDGRTWRPCGEFPASWSDGLRDLTTAPGRNGGAVHTFAWDAFADSFPYATVTIRIIASGGVAGEPTSSAPVTIGNPSDTTYAFSEVDGSDVNGCS